MKIGDLVKYFDEPAWSNQAYTSTGIIVADLPGDHIEAPAVSVLWASGELVERVSPRILEVVNESR